MFECGRHGKAHPIQLCQTTAYDGNRCYNPTIRTGIHPTSALQVRKLDKSDLRWSRPRLAGTGGDPAAGRRAMLEDVAMFMIPSGRKPGRNYAPRQPDPRLSAISGTPWLGAADAIRSTETTRRHLSNCAWKDR